MNDMNLEQINRNNFRVCLETLSRPGTTGKITPVLDSYLMALAYCLLYAEVSSCFKGKGTYEDIRAITGSPKATASQADYIFCEWPDKEILTAAKTGTLIKPDQSATLFIQTGDGGAKTTRVTLQGPGIQGSTQKTLPVDKVFLNRLREKNISYPLGIDCFLLNPEGVLIGIARTTTLEIS